MSLSDCLNKIAINASDKKAMLSSLEALQTEGMTQGQISTAENKVVEDYLNTAETTLDGIAKSVEESGGSVAKSDSGIVSRRTDNKGRETLVSEDVSLNDGVKTTKYIAKREGKTINSSGIVLTKDEFLDQFEVDEDSLELFDDATRVTVIEKREFDGTTTLKVKVMYDGWNNVFEVKVIPKPSNGDTNLKQSDKPKPWEMSSQEYNKTEDKKPREIFTVEVGSRKVEVLRNPTDQDLKTMNKEIVDSGKGSTINDPNTRFTYDSDGNVYRWPSIDAIHAHMEPVLEAREGVELNHNADSKPDHRGAVRRALYDGESVPDNVLAEYPGVVDEVKGIAGNKISITSFQPEVLDGEGDVDKVKTGKPISFRFSHNTESATEIFGIPNKESEYGRGYEPSGRFVSVVSEKFKPFSDQFITGYLTFNNPLVVPNDGLNWKKTLSEKYNGKTGKDLSESVINDGYDGIITTEKNHISETVDLTTFDKNVALYQSGDGDGKSFSSWSGVNIDDVIESDDINDQDFTEEKPYVVKVFHGTTHEFNTFEDVTGNKEGQFGAVNYFTSSDFDAKKNYAGEGADLTSRIEKRSERLEDELGDYDIEDIIMLSEKHGVEFDQENDAYPEELPKAIARDELSGGGGKVMEVYVKTEKPFVIGDSKILEFREEVDEADVQQLVADNNDISIDELNENVENYEDEMQEARYQLQDEIEDDLSEAIDTVAKEFDVDANELLSEIYEVLDGTTGGQLEDLMRKSESFAYAEDPENGDSIGFHLIGRVIEELGFDSIILKNADDRFSNMSMEAGTAHVQVFHADNTNIKSVENETFDKNDANIFKQSGEEKNLIVAHNLSEDNILHANKLGGLAVPSLATIKVGVSDFDSFGGISLLADPSITNSDKARTFDADIYSPRQPRSTYNINLKKFNSFVEGLETDGLPLDQLHISNLEGSQGSEYINRVQSVRYSYLKSIGKAPKTKKKKISPAIRKASKLNILDRTDPKFKKLAKEHYQKIIDAMYDVSPERSERYEGFYLNEDGSVNSSSLSEFENSVRRLKNEGDVDTLKLRIDIDKKMKVKKTKEGFDVWANEQFNNLVDGELLYKGTNNSGGQKFTSYTMESVVKEMTKSLQGGENFLYGAGSVRSTYAGEMKTINQIKAKRSNIVSESEMDKVKEDSKKALSDTLDKLKPFYKFEAESYGYIDDASNAIMEGHKGIQEAFRVTKESKQIIDDLIDYLVNLPTSYFETKIQRKVDFSEFKVAVIPRGTNKDVIKILKDSGLKIKTYDDKKINRQEVISKQTNLLFQNDEVDRGSFNPKGVYPHLEKSLINLYKTSDASTFLHETAHLFLDMQARFAVTVDSLDADQQTILDFLGLDSFDELIIGDNITDKQREAHEKWAETFEIYLREGKAPSLDLKEAFMAFKSWLVQLYKTLTDPRLSRGSLNADISGVFDRLLASEIEIEQATSNPEHDQLFRSKEQAGMTDKQWSDYQDKVTKAKNRSQSTLDEKLMKELYRRKTKEWNEEKQPIIEDELEKLKNSPAFKLKEAVDEAPMDRDITREALNLSKKLSTKERMAENKLIDLENDSLLIVATKSGGLDLDEFVSHGVDPAILDKKLSTFNNKQVFGMSTFKKKGGTDLGGLTEYARDNGFRNDDGSEMDDNDTLNMFLLEINQGENNYSIASAESRSEAEYREQNGIEEEEVEVPALEKFLPKVTKIDGIDPHDYQEIFGFGSIEEMFSSLIEAKNIKSKAKANAEQIMVDKYGDILNDGTIELEVRDAVHNEDQARLLLAELKALNKKAPPINRDLMKLQAKEVISGMKFSEIQPSKYYQAEVRHAKKTISDPDNAFTHKLQQLANHYLYREAIDAKERMERQRKYVRSMQTRVYPHTVVDPKYSSNLRMLSTAYEMKKGDARKNTDVDAVLNWMITQVDDDNDLIDFDIYDLALIQAINNRKDGIMEPFELPTFDDMTSSELKGLYDQLKHMRFLGGKLASEKRGDLKEKREKIARTIEKNGGEKKAFTHEEDALARRKNDAKEIIYSHRRIGGILETLDGFEEGYLTDEYVAITEATNVQLELTTDMAGSMDEAFSEILDSINKRRSTTITKQDGRLFKLTNRGRFTLGLNWGNEGNREALLRGLNNKANDEYTEADIMKMLSGMSDKEILALDKVWKAKEALWPKMSEVEVRLKGVSPPKIEASPFSINGIQLGGGHYRLHYRKDPDDSSRKKDSLDQVALGKVKLKKASSLNERVGSGGRQVDLELSHLFQDVSEDIHYIAFAELAERMNATFKGVSNPVVSAIIDHYGQPYYDNLITSISAIVQPDEGAEGIWKPLKWVRSNLTYGYLALSLRNVLQQPIAITNSFAQIGVGYTMKGALKFFSNPSAFKEQIKSVSPFMTNRTSLVNREAREQLAKIDSLHPKLGAMKNLAFAPQTFIDSLIAYPTWLGAKDKYMSENPLADEKKANKYADEMVAKTIGSGLSKDVGSILNKGEGWKQITFMGTFFNLTWNLHAENAQLLKRGKISGMEYARRIGWMAVAPAILTMFLLDDVPDDDDEALVHALKEVGHYNLSSLFLLRDASNAVIKGFDSSIPGLKFATGLKRISGDVKALVSGDEDLDAEMVASLLRGVQPLMPLPGSGQVARTLEGLSDPKQDAWGTLVEGKERN